MAVNVAAKGDKSHASSTAYVGTTAEPMRVPRTPLESRQGYHPKQDELKWRSPPTRQLSREKRSEYASDVRERFYDDYIGQRSIGDVQSEVLTGVHKLGFDPALYRANALQGLAYDPSRPVPAGVDFSAALKVERIKERQREMQRHRQRRMSDSMLLTKPANEYQAYHYRLEPLQPQVQLTAAPTLPPAPRERPGSAIQKSLVEETVNADIVPGVEDWFASASRKEQEAASKFFRTLSSHGKRPDPASKAALHRTRVRSAVMTPSRQQRREDKIAQATFQQMARESSSSDPPRPQGRVRRSSLDKGVAKGGMFGTATRQKPSHFTVHPDWASEAIDPFKGKRK